MTMAAISEPPKHVEAIEQRQRLSSGTAASFIEDSLADNINLRPSWGRAVVRPCTAAAADILPNANGQSVELEQQRKSSTAQKRPASAIADKSSDAAGPDFTAVAFGTSTPARSSHPTGVWFQQATSQGHSTPTESGSAFITVAVPSAKPAEFLSDDRDDIGIGKQLFNTPPVLQTVASTGGRSLGSDGSGSVGAAIGQTRGLPPSILPPGSPLGSGRASPAQGDLGGSDGGGSFLSCSPDGSPTANGMPPTSLFRSRTSVGSGITLAATPFGSIGGGGSLVPAAAQGKSQPLLGSELSPGTPSSGGTRSGGTVRGKDPSMGLGPGQVYFVVDPATGLVVGTAQATGTSTPGSMAPNTPDGAMSFHAPAAGGSVPMGGSARSSIELPRNTLASSGVVTSGQLAPSPSTRGSGSPAPGSGIATADMARAALSLLAGGGAAAGAGMQPQSAAAETAASAAAVSQHNALALANLAAVADSVARATAGGGSGGQSGAAAAVQAQQSAAELLMLLASASTAASTAPAAGGAITSDTAMAAFASTLDPATAAALLNEGLTTGGLTDDVVLALAQAAGVIDASAAAAGAAAQAASGGSAAGGGAPGGMVLPLQLPIPYSSTAGIGATPGSAVGTGLNQSSSFNSALLGSGGPVIFGPSSTQSGVAGLPDFGSSGSGAVGNASTAAAAARSGLLAGAGGLTNLAGLGNAGANWRSPSWRNANAMGSLGGLGSPGAAAGARTTQAAAALAPQGLLAGLASPPGPRGTGPKHNTLYKTEMCRSWSETGSCRYGSKCQFAHGPEELRPVVRHPKYKTENCRTFAATGACQYGSRCRFIHAAPPGSAMGTPRSQAHSLLGPEVDSPGGVSSVGTEKSPAGGGAALQSTVESVGAALWSRTTEPGAGNGALPAAAASLLSPAKTPLFSPAGRGAARHNSALSSPPFKMPRLGEQLGPLMQLPTGSGGGGDPPASRAVNASLALLSGGGVYGVSATGSAAAGGPTDAALQLFSAFGRGGEGKAAVATAPGAVGAGGQHPSQQSQSSKQGRVKMDKVMEESQVRAD